MSAASELSTRALEAAVAVAEAHGLRCAKPIVLADRSNVIVHLHPAPVVARVATTTALVRRDACAWLERKSLWQVSWQSAGLLWYLLVANYRQVHTSTAASP